MQLLYIHTTSAPGTDSNVVSKWLLAGTHCPRQSMKIARLCDEQCDIDTVHLTAVVVTVRAFMIVTTY